MVCRYYKQNRNARQLQQKGVIKLLLECSSELKKICEHANKIEPNNNNQDILIK